MKLDIQSPNTNLSPELRLHIERRLQFALSRFGTRIGQVTVRLSSLTGLKGGIDNRCRIEVLVLPSGQAVWSGPTRTSRLLWIVRWAGLVNRLVKY